MALGSDVSSVTLLFCSICPGSLLIGERAVFERFGLTLMVNHACNLRCGYCYTGEKLRRPMPASVARAAIDRAVRSLSSRGVLELAFFGGEPLVEADLILELIDYAAQQAAMSDIRLEINLTTNGTLQHAAAWQVMMLPTLRLAISHDGLPQVHDRHRFTVEGHGTSDVVTRTMRRLLAAGKQFQAVMVVGPDQVATMPAGIAHLYELGVRQFEPSLDLWAKWTRADGQRLKAAIRQCAEFWISHLPEIGISWLDEKAASLANVPRSASARCEFGHGEIAVAPSGRLYPCERLIGADLGDHPHRLPGNAQDGDNFLSVPQPRGKSAAECSSCAIQTSCSTSCRCSNFVRTGDAGRPDGLLCLFDQACYQETARVLQAHDAALA